MDQELFHRLSHIFVKKPGGRNVSCWLLMADLLHEADLTPDQESEIVTSVLGRTLAGQKSLYSYRSKIIDLAHPVNLTVFREARSARTPHVGVDDLIAIARGAKTFLNGAVVLVDKSPAGGWNEKPANQKISEGIDSAFAAAKAAGIPVHQVKLIFNERLRHLQSDGR